MKSVEDQFIPTALTCIIQKWGRVGMIMYVSEKISQSHCVCVSKNVHTHYAFW